MINYNVINYDERKKLEDRKFTLEYKNIDFIGWDCEGQKLYIGDKVEVEVEDNNGRCQKPEYAFCSKGKQGIIVRHFCDWVVTVLFPGGVSVGCVDINLKKICS